MLSPVDLLEQAEEFASRIPAGREYEEDRNSSWLWIGEAWLKVCDGDAAIRALGRLDHRCCRGVLAHAIAMWTVSHPGFHPAHDFLLSLSEYAPAFARGYLTDLAFPLTRLCTEPEIRAFVDRIPDPSLRGAFLAAWSYFIRDEEKRRAMLEAAESLVQYDTDRTALQRALRAAGHAAAEVPTDDTQIAKIEKLLSDVERIVADFDDAESDTPHARLERFLKYRYNDLKVFFLVDSAIAGGVADTEVEQLILGDAFARIEAPRVPSVFRNPCTNDFAHFWFGRAARLREDDRALLDGSHLFAEPQPPQDEIQRRAVEIFRNFPVVASDYSMEQIDQGLWLLLGASIHKALQFDESMLIPFRDYYAHCGERYEGSAFYMWWDLVKPDGVAILEQILALPSAACQSAALHGLNHLDDRERAFAIVSRYIEENRDRLTPEELDHAEKCRDGRMQ